VVTALALDRDGHRLGNPSASMTSIGHVPIPGSHTCRTLVAFIVVVLKIMKRLVSVLVAVSCGCRNSNQVRSNSREDVDGNSNN